MLHVSVPISPVELERVSPELADVGAHRISQRAIADVVGHANLETQQIYIQSLEEERGKAVDRISGQLHRLWTDPSQMSIPFEHEEGWVN